MSTAHRFRDGHGLPFARRSHVPGAGIFALALVTCLFLSFFAQNANADEVSQGDRMVIGAIANAAFPASSCYDQLRVVWLHTIQIPEDDSQAAAVQSAGFQLQGYAYGMRDGSCTVGVRSDLGPQAACTVAVHEAGHLAGQQHGSSALMGTPDSTDPTHPGGVMADDYIYPACTTKALGASLPLWMAEDELAARISDSALRQCRRVNPLVVDCVSSRRFGKRIVRKSWRVSNTEGNGIVRVKRTGKAVVV